MMDKHDRRTETSHARQIWRLGAWIWLAWMGGLVSPPAAAQTVPAADGAGRSAASEISVSSRPGVQTRVFWHPLPDARATVLLLPGGAGSYGRVVDGLPDGDNFLVRSAGLFSARGFQVAIAGRPDDHRDLDYADRITPWHLADLRAVVAAVHARSAAPIWLVGTSRGTVSATAAAIALADQPALGIAGLVLSSSIVNPGKPGALPRQDLAAVHLPVLMVHHRQDACPVCPPADVPAVLGRFTGTADKHLAWIDGGGPPRGERCHALHWHGFIGVEAEAVGEISDWIDRHLAGGPSTGASRHQADQR